MDEIARDHFNKAQGNLKEANEELFKPEEDVVSYLVCKNSQYAIQNYLKGYLTLRGFETHDNETMESLLYRCKSLNSNFKEISLNIIDCRAHKIDSKYCQDVSKVSSCFGAADGLDTFIRKLNLF